MKKFNFRLQKLLKLEVQREQQAMVKLHSLINNLDGQIKILEFLKGSLAKNQENLSGRNKVFTNSHELMLYENYIITINDRIDGQTKMVNDANNEVENARNEMLSIQKDRKILEKLRDKYRKEYIDNKKKAEIKQLDEVSVTKKLIKSCS